MLKRFLTWKTVPLALLLVTIAAYGLLSPTLGFYWDDWPLMWFLHTFGAKGYEEALAVDRPFLAGIYWITTSLLKTVPIQWQILAILSRWLTSVVLWWSLKKLWPENLQQVTWAALLFAVYPGFKQQPISVVYSNGFLLFAMFLASFGLMVAAIRNRERYWHYTIPALIGYSICTFSTEYYVGLDMIRPIMIWLALSESPKINLDQIKKVFLNWAPYLIVLFVFLIWRVFVFEFPTYQPQLLGEISSSPLNGIVHFVYRIIQDIFLTGWQAWGKTFHAPSLSELQTTSSLLYWILVVGLIPIVWFYLKTLGNDQPEKHSVKPDRWARQAMLLGFAGLLFGGAPFWITDLKISLEFPWDRFTLAFMLGSSLFLVGFIDWVIRTRMQKIILLSLVVSMAIGADFSNTNTYRREWNTHNDLLWQMVWRAPGLKPGTTLVTNHLPMSYYSDNSLTAPLNWTYAPENKSKDIPYLFAFTEVRLGAGLPALEEDLPIHQSYRSASFNSSTNNALAIYYAPPGCLRIIDPQYDTSLPSLPDAIKEAMVISHPDQILVDANPPATPPIEIVGPEPDHNWCYYFEKAELARQMDDWNTIADLGIQALDQKKLMAQEPTELYIFIEAFARSGDWENSMRLIREAYRQSSTLQSDLCNTITRFEKKYSPDNNAAPEIDKTRERLHCPAN